jgi:hypothetical protein
MTNDIQVGIELEHSYRVETVSHRLGQHIAGDRGVLRYVLDVGRRGVGGVLHCSGAERTARYRRSISSSRAQCSAYVLPSAPER